MTMKIVRHSLLVAAASAGLLLTIQPPARSKRWSQVVGSIAPRRGAVVRLDLVSDRLVVSGAQR